MTRSEWDRVKALIEEASDLEPAARRTAVEEFCGSDSELRHEVESLLQAWDGAGTLLLQPPVAQGVIQEVLQEARSTERRHWDAVGPYRITRALGEGGMGAVYEGIREDGGVFLRVAIKTLRHRYSGTRLVEHFRTEQQVLARLTHKAIARLIDWGVAPDGRPFLAMEYVEGIPFDEYLRQDLPLGVRLKTFLEVLEAVEHAHQRLVAHGDIKPGNIRVLPDGSIKLLDFGVARLLDSPEGDVAPALTQAYASPELLAGQSLTPECDVFSLGVVLCETIAGRKPYLAGWGSRWRVLAELLSQRPLPPSVLAPPLRAGRELDSIVLKAVALNPEQRYRTVEALSRDLQAYLARRPVAAYSDSALYRVSKFGSRHAIALAVASAGFVALVTLIAISLWQGRIAQQRFDQVRSLANYIIFDLDDRLREIPAGTALRGELVRRATSYLDELEVQQSGDDSLTREAARSYLRLGDIQGRPSTPNLGDIRGAMESYEKAIRLFESLYRHDPDSDQARSDAAMALARKAAVLKAAGRFKDALAYETRSLKIVTELLSDNPGDAELRRRVAHYLNLAGASHYHLGEWEAALSIRQQALTLWQQIAKDHPSIPNREGLALAYNRVAVMESRAGRHSEAERLQAIALEIYSDLSAKYPENLPVQRGYATAHHYMGSFLLKANKLEVSRRHLEEALAMREKIIRADPEDTRNKSFQALHKYELAECLRRLGDISQASRHAGESLATRRGLAASDPGNAGAQAEVALALARLAVLRQAEGDAAGEQAAMSESAALFQKLQRSGQLNAHARELMEQALSGSFARELLPDYIFLRSASGRAPSTSR